MGWEEGWGGGLVTDRETMGSLVPELHERWDRGLRARRRRKVKAKLKDYRLLWQTLPVAPPCP